MFFFSNLLLTGFQKILCHHVFWIHYLDCCILLPHGVVGSPGWWNNWDIRGNYGVNHTGSRNINPWPYHQCHCCTERLRWHGCLQLRRQQYLRHHCWVSINSMLKDTFLLKYKESCFIPNRVLINFILAVIKWRAAGQPVTFFFFKNLT